MLKIFKVYKSSQQKCCKQYSHAAGVIISILKEKVRFHGECNETIGLKNAVKSLLNHIESSQNRRAMREIRLISKLTLEIEKV